MSAEVSKSGHGERDPSATSEFALSIFLEGMDPEDDFQVVLPIGYARNSIGWLLDQVFPADEQGRNTIEAYLNVRANPDLPEIYAVMLQVTEEWRMGLCALSVSTGSDYKLDLADPASNHLVSPSADGAPADGPTVGAPLVGALPCLDLRVAQEYSALEYAVSQGFWQSRDELLDWLRGLTVLYFMDKFEYDLPAPDPDSGQYPISGVARLQDENLVALCGDTGGFYITEDGRGLIGRLLAETESYIEQYDHFKDVDFDEDAGEVRFERSRGVDLRVQVFIAEGLDPIRTVFLLRLYDGAMDEFAPTWPALGGFPALLPPSFPRRRETRPGAGFAGKTGRETGLLDDEGFFDKFLEPAVNRYNVPEELIGRVIDAGYAYMEEQHEQARQLASEREIVGRVRDAARSNSHEEDHGGGDNHRALDESDSNVTLPNQGAGNPDVWKQQ